MEIQFSGSILFIEDEMLSRTLLINFLEEAGLTFIEQDHALNMLEIIQSHSVSLILLDIILPYQDGFETLRKIRLDYPEMPVIIMSSSQAYLDISQ